MKNRYEIREDITVIFINSPKYGEIETIINTSKLEKMDEYTGTWVFGGKGYVQGWTFGVKKKCILLHRYIKNAPDEFVVDHINRNPLDNTDKNLRCVTVEVNSRNREGCSMKGPQVAKGIYQSGTKYVLFFKKEYLGTFETLKEAEEEWFIHKTNEMG